MVFRIKYGANHHVLIWRSSRHTKLMLWIIIITRGLIFKGNRSYLVSYYFVDFLQVFIFKIKVVSFTWKYKNVHRSIPSRRFRAKMSDPAWEDICLMCNRLARTGPPLYVPKLSNHLLLISLQINSHLFIFSGFLRDWVVWSLSNMITPFIYP